jgi:phage shock protein A
MSILKSLQAICREHARKLDQALANPVRDGQFAIEDAEAEVVRFETQLHDLISQTIQLTTKRDHAAAEVQKFQAFAERAAAAQSKDDVVVALEQKKLAQSALDALNQEITANQKVQADAKTHIAQVRAKIENAKNSEEQDKMRIATADLRTQLAGSANSLGNHGVFAQIDALNEAAAHKEADAAATEQLSGETPAGKEQSLEDKYGGAAGSSAESEADALLAQYAKK